MSRESHCSVLVIQLSNLGSKKCRKDVGVSADEPWKKETHKIFQMLTSQRENALQAINSSHKK